MQQLKAETISAVGVLFSDLSKRTNMPGDELEESVKDALLNAAAGRGAPLDSQALRQRATLLIGQEIEQHGLPEIVGILRRHFAVPDLAPEVPEIPAPVDLSAEAKETEKMAGRSRPELEIENAIRPAGPLGIVPPVEEPTHDAPVQDAIRPVTTVLPKTARNDAEHEDAQEGVIKGVRNVGDTAPAAPKQGYEPPARLLNNRFVLGDNGEYRRVGETRVALVDEVEQIRFIDKQMDSFQAGIELAKAKEWQAIQVTGTEKFRSEAWFHARMAGLEVVGYEPQAKDLERLETAQRRHELDGKGAEKPNEAVQQSRQAAENFVLDSGAGLQVANNTTGRYAGPVVHDTEHHFVQDLGRGVAVLHEKSRFTDAELVKGTRARGSVKIQYQEGKGAFDGARDRDRDVGHSR